MWTLTIGFFMILVDSTIVSVATPAIINSLHADLNSGVWVTSAYLLAYVTPLLIAGRLGDRFGPKQVYLIGLIIFTASSLWCGLSGSIETLIISRVFQGLGGALMTPQTMAVIVRIFPPQNRGRAMALWGAVAGIASLAGPIAGGLLIDGPGWEWIFFVNIPAGMLALVLALRFVPKLNPHSHRSDILGAVLSGAGMLLIVFGIQQGASHDWAAWIWLLIAVGVALMIGFVIWQRFNAAEPLLPLKLFRDRNFSLSNIAISMVGFMIIALSLPLMIYAQSVRSLSPTEAALLMVPMALLSMVLAPWVGRLVDRCHPRYLAGFGLLSCSVSMLWLSGVMQPHTPIWHLLFPISLLGIGTAFTFGPLGVSATRNLPMALAGAGSGVYNATRQLGSVLGSAAIAAMMQSRLNASLPATSGNTYWTGLAELPPQLLGSLSTAMAQSMLLPAIVVAAGFLVVIFLERPKHLVGR